MKKVLIGLAAVALVVASVPLFAAYEAHVINVTAHIENALSVDTEPINFGTVFPQEYLTDKTFTVALSSSFLSQKRANTVDYKIEQKPKCWNGSAEQPVYGLSKKDANGAWVCVDSNMTIMTDLCQFLSKTSQSLGTVSELSYYTDETPEGPSANDHCQAPATTASGELDLAGKVTSHTWTVDLKVPPVAGSVGQDWPASCASYTVPKDGADYGCDLWIEVTGITETPKLDS